MSDLALKKLPFAEGAPGSRVRTADGLRFWSFVITAGETERGVVREVTSALFAAAHFPLHFVSPKGLSYSRELISCGVVFGCSAGFGLGRQCVIAT